MRFFKYILLSFLTFFVHFLIYAQHSFQKNTIDVQHYQFEIKVNDTTNSIIGTANITLKLNQSLKEISLDLISLDKNGKGMFVTEVLNNHKNIPFKHTDNQLYININPQKKDAILNLTIKYKGIPKDGLIISKNKFGERTFFGDNWPTRAKNWLPCNDNLTDKATVDFIVKTPKHYNVVAVGSLIDEKEINNHEKRYHYSCKNPLSTYLMVIGIAKFSVQNLGVFHQKPVSTWVYPQNKKEGFYDYAQAVHILDFYVNHIAPFPFIKLANVQSNTRFGGMENAGTIFYSEKSVTGKRDQEALMAHEIAHQWFGDSVTEKQWSQLWLSEGFATYFTNLYFEYKYGKEKFNKRLINGRNKVIRFYQKQQTPIIDTLTANYMKLLNTNSYEKGAWFLHMLRVKIGDDLFWKSIKKYYNTYKFNNATSDDFKSIVESIYKKDLTSFFNQWLNGIGQPELSLQWQNKNNKIEININQTQKTDTKFSFPLELLLQFEDGTTIMKTINVQQKNQKFTLPSNLTLTNIIIDPNIHLLYNLK